MTNNNERIEGAEIPAEISIKSQINSIRERASNKHHCKDGYKYFPSFEEINEEATKEETLQWLLFIIKIT